MSWYFLMLNPLLQVRMIKGKRMWEYILPNILIFWNFIWVMILGREVYLEISGHIAVLCTLKSHWLREFLGNQWLGLHSLTVEGPGSIRVRDKIPQAHGTAKKPNTDWIKTLTRESFDSQFNNDYSWQQENRFSAVIMNLPRGTLAQVQV